MVARRLNRRQLLVGLGAVGLAPHFAWAEDYVDLRWKDLLPEGQVSIPPMLQSLIDHDQPAMSSQQPSYSGVRTEWNDQVIRLPGFVVPIDYAGTGITAFILVPFVGACVHVPPPPANQLVFVTTPEPFESAGLYEPVNVVGKLQVSSISTHLADIAYTMAADRIEPYVT